MDKRYKAFISYSWADKVWGEWLHKTLETYRTPKALVGVETSLGPAPPRLHPIFKDREEEAAGHGIGAAIEAAMAASEFLIVICSPRSAQSKWVNREVAWFKKNKSKENILALVVDGEPGVSLSPDKPDEECFPATLLYEVDDDLQPTAVLEDVPLAADARDDGDGKRAAKLKLAAALLGVGLDDLVKRDERRRAARRRWVTGAMAASIAVLSGLTLFAFDQRNAARRAQAEAEDALQQFRVQYDQAESLVEFMIDDLRHKLQQEVQLKVLADIGKRAQDYYDTQMTIHIDDDALGRRARVLKLLGDLEHDFGNSEASVRLFEDSIAASTELLSRDPNNPTRLIELAHATQGLGNMAYQLGDLDLAEAQMNNAVDLTTRLTALDEENLEWRSERASALANAGIIQLKNNNFDLANETLSRAAVIKREALDSAHDLQQARFDLATTLSWLAETYVAIGDDYDALNLRNEEDIIYAEMLVENPNDQFALKRRAINRISLANLHRYNGSIDTAAELAKEAATLANTVLESDPSHIFKIDTAVRSQVALGMALVANGASAEATQAALRAQHLVDAVASSNQSRGVLSNSLLGNVQILTALANAEAATDYVSCREALATIDPIAKRFATSASEVTNDIELATTASFLLMLAGDYAALNGEEKSANNSWADSRKILSRSENVVTELTSTATKSLAAQLALRQNAESNIENYTVCSHTFQ